MSKKWEFTLDVSDVFYTGPSEGEELEEGMRLVAQKVERYQNSMFPTDWEFESIADELVDAAQDRDIDWFNAAWDALYDWADHNRVWIKTRGD